MNHTWQMHTHAVIPRPHFPSPGDHSCAALAFAALEVVLQLALHSTIKKRLLAAQSRKQGGGALSAKAQRQASVDATTTVTKIVGGVHNAIQVPTPI